MEPETNGTQHPGDLVAFFGGPADTGNLGVSALGEATVAAVHRHDPDAEVLVFDNGRGRRHGQVGDVDVMLDGAWLSRRMHRDESLWTMAAASRVPVLPNRNVAALRRARLVLDISGGDSFTDLYGPRRWRLVTLPKTMALQLRRPLVLLPQTYGPFEDPRRRRAAADIVAAASAAWTRDPDGLDALRDLLGDRFDPTRHRQGVDVAFALPARPPDLPDDLGAWVRPGRDGPRTVGLNVSGLLANDPAGAVERFGLTGNYPRLVLELARRLLSDVADRILLVPHVRGATAESDDEACDWLQDELDVPTRVRTLPPGLDAAETKWCVQDLAWFCGTRMHATIAALSSGVPAAAVAYSSKTRGVFETAGMSHAVADARRLDDDASLQLLLSQAERADRDRVPLQERAATLRQVAGDQFATILGRRPGDEGGS